MNEVTELETIELAFATYGPYIEITDELDILFKSDDGGRHIEFTVLTQQSAKYLRESVPHTFEGFRTIIRYSIEKTKD